MQPTSPTRTPHPSFCTVATACEDLLVYGVPVDLDLTRFVGSRLINIGIGLFNTSFQFEVAALDYVGINALGRWEATTPAGQPLGGRARDGSECYDEELGVRFLIGSHVAIARVRDSRTLQLLMTSGVALWFFDDSDQYESITITGLGDAEHII